MRFATGLLLVAMTDAQVAALPAECREFLTRVEIARQCAMADVRMKSP